MMHTVLTFALRNIRVYVRNRMSVFFSFLSVLIIIGLYALFLGKVQADAIRGTVGDLRAIRSLVNSWIMAGLLSVNSVTISLGVLGTMVFDKEYKRFSDFIVAPVSRVGIVVSYLISACVIGFVFNLIALVAGELYIVSAGGALLTVANALQVIGMLALSVVSSSAIMFLVASFLTTGSAFGILSTLLGTLIGFITGVYVPLGILPDAVQKFVLLIPFSHSAAMLRQVFCQAPLAAVFRGAPTAVQAHYARMYGIELFWNNTGLSMATMIAILAATTVLFLLLSGLKLRGYKRG
ncbi:MAG TPA: ABC transporter permease [Spirochaetia bacterium]|nr:ABC transporter permease [Spirochaetia bacterium]